MQVMAGRADRFMPQVVAEMAQVDRVIGHVRSGRVPPPVGGCLIDAVGDHLVFFTTLLEARLDTLDKKFQLGI